MTESQPLVSIVTPTRDQGRFIEQTLRSVAGQTYSRIETNTSWSTVVQDPPETLLPFEASKPAITCIGGRSLTTGCIRPSTADLLARRVRSLLI